MEENKYINTIEIQGKKMDYIHFGKQGGKVFVLIPGLSLKSVIPAATAIVNQYKKLEEIGYDFYLFDHIEKEPSSYNLENIANDTVEAIKKLNLNHITLMGVSMGGMVSQAIAVNNPDLVDKLVLCSTAPCVEKDYRIVFETWKDLATKRDTDKLMESFGEKVYTHEFYEKFKNIILSSGKDASELDYSNFITNSQAILDFDITDRLNEIKCPTFVIGSIEDQVFGINSTLTLAKKINCKHHIYEGYGHGAYDEAPDYLGRICDFLINSRHNDQSKKIGIVIAIERELKSFLMSNYEIETINDGHFTCFKTIINNHDVYAIKSGWGLIDAAMATQYLITKYNVEIILNFGVTGALDPSLKVSDLFYVSKCLNFDFDTSSIDDVVKHQYGDMEDEFIYLDNSLIELVKTLEPDIKEAVDASGDLFIDVEQDKIDRFNAGCNICDMEIVAIARVALLNNVKCLSIKCISDEYDGDGHDFEKNVRESADKAFKIIDKLINSIN